MYSHSGGESFLGSGCASGRGRGRGGPRHRLEVGTTNQPVRPPPVPGGPGQQGIIMGGAASSSRHNQRQGREDINPPGAPPSEPEPNKPPGPAEEKENEDAEFWDMSTGEKLNPNNTGNPAEWHSFENGEWDEPIRSRPQCTSSALKASMESTTNGDENCDHIYSQLACHFEHPEPALIVYQCLKCFNVCCSAECAEHESQKPKPELQSLEPPSQVENAKPSSSSGLSVRSHRSRSSESDSQSVKSETGSTKSARKEPKPKPPSQVENVKAPSVSGLSIRSKGSCSSGDTFYSCQSETSSTKSTGIEPKPKPLSFTCQNQVENVKPPFSSSGSSCRPRSSISSGNTSNSVKGETKGAVAPAAPTPKHPKPAQPKPVTKRAPGPNKLRSRTGAFAPPKALGFQENSIQAQYDSMKSSEKVVPISSITPVMHADTNGRSSLESSDDIQEYAPKKSITQIKEKPVFSPASVVRTNVLKTHNGIMREDLFPDYAKSLLESNSRQLINSPFKWPVGIPFRVHVIGIIPNACIVIQSAPQRAKLEEMMDQLRVSCFSRAAPIATFLYCAVIYESNFYRGQIEEISEISVKCRVRLVDVGQLVVVDCHDIYSLPEKFLRIHRQMGTVSPINVKAKQSHGDVLKVYLEELLVGKTITATLTHRLDFLSDKHYYGEIVLENGQTLSDVLIDDDLAEIHDSRKDNAESIMHPDFEDYEKPRLKRNESVTVVISQIISPDEFFVTKENSDEPANLRDIVQHTIKSMATFGGPCSFQYTYYSGTRMCLAAHPDDATNMCRAYCRIIDFTMSTPQATVLLIDFGIIYSTDLKELTEYIRQVVEYPPLAYRCRLAAKPTGENWTDLVCNGLNSLKERSQTEKLTAVCISSNNGKNAVMLRAPYASQYWLQYLEDAGHVIQDMRCVGPPQVMNLQLNWREFLTSMDPFITLSSITSETSPHSPLFCGRIPPAEPLMIYDKLKTQKLKGFYSYIVMTERCYNVYKDLRAHCNRVYRELPNENITFKIGDIVIAPWSRDSYQRACITGFEECFGRKFACLYLFDIGRFLRILVDKLIPADDVCMKTERLSHVVWLEGTTPDATILLNTDYNMITSLTKGWTIVSNVTLGMGRSPQYALRLSVVDSSGHLNLLTDFFKHFEIWDWEKLHDLGICTFKDIFNEMYPDNSFRFSSKDFQMEVKAHFKEMLEGNLTVLIRRAKVNYETKKLDLLVTPAVAKMDFKILTRQMIKFSEKVRLVQPSPESSTYPKLVLVKRMGIHGHSDNIVALSKSNCVWHRCLYRDDKLALECVDCFERFGANKDSDLQKMFETHKLDIREIFPEMLKVPPLGLRLTVDLPELPLDFLFQVSEKVLRIGANVEVVVQKYSCSWDDAKNRVAGIPATVPKWTERLHEVVAQMASAKCDVPE